MHALPHDSHLRILGGEKEMKNLQPREGVSGRS